MAFALVATRTSDPTPVRALVFEAAPGERYAINSEQLHRQPSLLSPIAPAFCTMLLALDWLAGLLIAASIVASFLVAWWLFVPGTLAALAMRHANRRMAARMAYFALREDPAAFTYLYKAGLLWRVS